MSRKTSGTVTLTPEQVEALRALLGTPEAAQTVVAASRKAKKAPPAWVVERAKRKAARRALAATIRASGKEPTGALWAKAKKAAGIA